MNKKKEVAARKAASIFNMSRRLSEYDRETDTRSPGLGLRFYNRKKAVIGLERDEAHNMVYPSGMHYVSSYVVRDQEKQEEILARNPDAQHVQYVQKVEMLIIACSSIHRQGGTAKKFVESVWKIDKEKYEGDLHPFVSLRDIVQFLTEDGKNCVHNMMDEQGWNPSSVVFLPVESSVSGRGAWWTHNRTKKVRQNFDVTDTEELDLADAFGQ